MANKNKSKSKAWRKIKKAILMKLGLATLIMNLMEVEMIYIPNKKHQMWGRIKIDITEI
jgi:hypothetical protein